MQGSALHQGLPGEREHSEISRLADQGRIADAAQSLLCDNALPGVTGRVCPQETQCEAECVRGAKGQPVGIGYLERYVADWARDTSRPTAATAKPAPSGRKVAIVGSGPAGLTAAGELAKRGHDVTDLRSAAQTRRRAGLWHPGIPPAQENRRAGSRAASGSGRENRMQHRSSAAPTPMPELREQF